MSKSKTYKYFFMCERGFFELYMKSDEEAILKAKKSKAVLSVDKILITNRGITDWSRIYQRPLENN